MSQPMQEPPVRRVSTFRRVVAGILDFFTVFGLGGYAIGLVSGQTTDKGFALTGWAALALLVLIIAYFYLGWKKLGGTLWQRLLAVPPHP